MPHLSAGGAALPLGDSREFERHHGGSTARNATMPVRAEEIEATWLSLKVMIPCATTDHGAVGQETHGVGICISVPASGRKAPLRTAVTVTVPPEQGPVVHATPPQAGLRLKQSVDRTVSSSQRSSGAFAGGGRCPAP